MAEKLIALQPIRTSTSEWDEIEARIKRAFLEAIYRPLLKALKIPQKKLKNAPDSALVEAIKEGKITYKAGIFRGQFNASISKELRSLGAVWDKKSASYKISSIDLPIPLRAAISTAEVFYAGKMLVIDKQLAAADDFNMVTLQFEERVGVMMDKF